MPSPTTTRALLAALAAGSAVAAATALPATGQEAPRTLTFASSESARDMRQIDAAPKGESLGDRLVFASTLRREGKVAGRMEGDCLAVDRTYEGMACTLTAILADGSITFQGAAVDKPIPGGVGGTREEYAVTGGTGAYAGMSGTLRRSGNGQRDTLVIQLAG
jgi:hypothetical protein